MLYEKLSPNNKNNFLFPCYITFCVICFLKFNSYCISIHILNALTILAFQLIFKISWSLSREARQHFTRCKKLLLFMQSYKYYRNINFLLKNFWYSKNEAALTRPKLLKSRLIIAVCMCNLIENKILETCSFKFICFICDKILHSNALVRVIVKCV